MIKKILSILLILTVLLSIFSCNYVFASDVIDDKGKETAPSSSQPKSTSSGTVDDVFKGANGFVTEGEEKLYGYTIKDEKTGKDKEVPAVLNTENLVNTSNFIYNLLLAVAMVIAVAIGIVIGIKMMMASASEKAEVKELLWPYVFGCIVVFGAMGIWKLAVTVFSGF